MAMIDSKEPVESNYDLIPYAITDGYDNIEEVDENDDVPFPNFSPRLGPLPSPGYSGLTPDEPKPPGVYSRMEHSIDRTGDAELESNIDRSKNDYSKVSDVEDSGTKKRIAVNSYLDIEAELAEEEEIPSTYLKLNDDSSQSKFERNAIETNQEKGLKKKQATRLNSYLQLVTTSDMEIAEDSPDMPSAYLKLTDDAVVYSKPTKDVLEVNQGAGIPSSYLTTREIKS